MKSAIARSTVVALSIFWAAGCASTETPATPAPKAASVATPDATNGDPTAKTDLATLTKDLPSSLNGEIRRAQLLRSKGALDDAARSLAQLMLVAPDDARIVGEYGKVLAEQGRSKDALAFLKRAIELQPHDWTLYSALGVAYDQMDNHADAHSAYEHALSLNPGEASVLNNYAVSRMLAGDLAGAKRLLSQASARGTDTSKIANNLAVLASMEPPKAAAVASAATSDANHSVQPEAVPGAAAPGKAPIAVMALGAPNPRVVMQRVPADPLAGPVANAHRAPQKLAGAEPAPAAPDRSAPPASTRAAHEASAVSTVVAPNPRVVMQRVPIDPLAGPVVREHHAAHKIAGAASAKPATPGASPSSVPDLRTAADTD